MNDFERIHVLFVCTMNKWRSSTAETLYRKSSEVSVRSAGTSRSARRRVSIRDIRWANLILVMEDKHKSRLKAEFRDELRYKSIFVLDIPDDYRYMDEELIELIRSKADPIILEN